MDTFIAEVAPTIQASGKAAGSATQQDAESGMLAAHVPPIAQTCRAHDAKGVDSDCTDTLIAGTFHTTGRGWWNESDVGGTLRANTSASDGGVNTNLIAFSAKDHGADAAEGVSPTLRAMGHGESHANGGGQVAVCIHGTQDPDVAEGIAHPLGRNHGQENALFQPFASATEFLPQSSRVYSEAEAAPTLQATGARGGIRAPQVAAGAVVRRLTPVECERLQGFPDGWTAIPWRGKPAEDCPDGPRYRGLGNSMAVPCMRWILTRIEAELAGGRRDTTLPP